MTSENLVPFPHYDHEILTPLHASYITRILKQTSLRELPPPARTDYNLFAETLRNRFQSLNSPYMWSCAYTIFSGDKAITPNELSYANGPFMEEVGNLTIGGILVGSDRVAQQIDKLNERYGPEPIRESLLKVFDTMPSFATTMTSVCDRAQIIYGTRTIHGKLESVLSENIDTSTIPGYNPLMDIIRVYGEGFPLQFNGK